MLPMCVCNAYVDITAKKVNNSIAFLRRNLSRCPRDNKAKCYTSLVRSYIEYVKIAWDLLTNKNIYRLEAVQQGAARFDMVTTIEKS